MSSSSSPSDKNPDAIPDNQTDKTVPMPDKPYQRPSGRMFRRSRRAQMRRQQLARDDTNFFRAVFSLAGVATAFVFILIYLASSGGGGGLADLAPLARPWVGSFSRLEIGGFAIIALLAFIYWRRVRKRR